MNGQTLGWGGIARLGAVQAAIGSIVVLATSTLNRVMVIELALPAVFPGLLVAIHYAVQMARTRVGHGADVGGRLTSWIVGGMAVLAAGGIAASASIGLMEAHRTIGIIAAVAAYIVIGLGVGACGTALLVLLSKSVTPARRPAAATLTWLMMFVGFVVTTAVVGQLLDPYSSARLLAVTAAVAAVDFALTLLVLRNLEPYIPARDAQTAVRPFAAADKPAADAGLAAEAGQGAAATDARPMSDVRAAVAGAVDAPGSVSARASFRDAFAQVWSEPAARQFTLFVFVSMLAYSGQELLLEPFVGRVYLLSPGHSARIASLQHGGALLGMILVAILGSIPTRWRTNSLRAWTVGGCIGSAIALGGLIMASMGIAAWPIRLNMFILGVANGVFAVSAIGSMMTLVGCGDARRQGLRMGLWGAAQAVAFAVGGAVSAATVDAVSKLLQSSSAAYGSVFMLQALLFAAAAAIAASIGAVAVPTGWRGVSGRPLDGDSVTSASPQRGARPQPNASSRRREHPSYGATALRGDHTSSVLTLSPVGTNVPTFDVVVIGGGPAGATAATDLARRGYRVALLDRAGRIKPCGGAIPPKLIEEFDIPTSLLVARVTGARMVSPSSQRVDMRIEGGYVGMVNRETFDEWLRERAHDTGCERITGTFESIQCDAADKHATIRYRQGTASKELRARVVIGADGAQSEVARQAMPKQAKPRYVAAYHEILYRPSANTADYNPTRCDIFYQGKLSPDFYAWIFPHGDTLSIGVGSAKKGFSLRRAVSDLREQTGLSQTQRLRCEGAPIPLQPLRRWDNGRNVVLAGDAAGVVAPASGEGIYYAMFGGRLAADAADSYLQTSNAADLRIARRKFMRAHGTVFFILGMMQRFWYISDRRRERFVSICKDPDVQRLTWEAYLYKRLVRSRPLAHARIFFKDLMHLLGVART